MSAEELGDYEELESMPEVCSEPLSYIGIDPVVFRHPYGGVDEVVVEEDYLVEPGGTPPIVWEAFQVFKDTGFDEAGPPPEGKTLLGWDSEEEELFLEKMRHVALQAKVHTAWTTAEAREQIRELGGLAYEALGEIENIYATHDNDIILTGGELDSEGGIPMAYSLSWSEDEIRNRMTPGHDAKLFLWADHREHARTQVRELWDYALSMLWCARVGIAMQESYLRNKKLYDEREEEKAALPEFAPTVPRDPPRFELVPLDEPEVPDEPEIGPPGRRPPSHEPGFFPLPGGGEGEGEDEEDEPFPGIGEGEEPFPGDEETFPEEESGESASKGKAGGGAGLAIAAIAVLGVALFGGKR